MMCGVVDCGFVFWVINLDVFVVGKIGIINEVKDVWFVGFINMMVVGCYIGYDMLMFLGCNIFGGNICGFVFNEFMQVVVEKYGGGVFCVFVGGQFINIDCFFGVQLFLNVFGDNVVVEYFCLGEELVFGVVFDGGFVMGLNLFFFDEVDIEVVIEVIMLIGESMVVMLSVFFGMFSLGGFY